ncbi:sulfurtransferase [Agromyces sp. LHK192]|uniref:sulfurtransferase n=1 Tax=Agromyces sp. LHK192 TaxID=2498704 RepID=UPI000FD99FEF|nr:rhodanese-like domain-containing protein [Agromyces sp. LHK192]
MTSLELPSALVSADWVAEHLGDERLVVVDATVIGSQTEAGFRWLSGLDAYLVDGHVPGAVFADLIESFSDPDGRFSFARPDLDRLRDAATELGIDDSRTVVVYDASLGQWATRLWWLLQSAGFPHVAVLDGGLARWVADGRALETGYEAPSPAGPLTLIEQSGWWADGDEVRRIVDGEADASLVCALPRSDFAGETGRFSRRGHIPGSVSVPVSSVVDRETKRFVDDEARDSAVSEVGDGRVVLYCGAGIAATGTGFVLRQAGRSDVAVYDGSLDEWSADPTAPLVTLA